MRVDGYAILNKLNLKPSKFSTTDLQGFDENVFNLMFPIDDPLAFDLETTSLEPMDGSIRSIAIANDLHAIALDFNNSSKDSQLNFINWLMKRPLIAHNITFDGGWLFYITGRLPNIEACTLGLFKQLATEGYLGQQWGLKYAMKNVLGWPESNEEDLYTWLKANKKTAAQMAQAPWDILGKYNALDAVATYQLFSYFSSIINKPEFAALKSYHYGEFKELAKLLINQKFDGISININYLDQYEKSQTALKHKAAIKFVTNNLISNYILEFDDNEINKIIAAKPTQFTKTGKVAVNYTKWENKVAEAKMARHFNIDSNKHLQWLFYEKLGLKHGIKTSKGGELAVSKKALPHLGELGDILKEYRALRDRLKFVTSLKSVIRGDKLHPNIKISATVTGRCAGGIE